MASLSVDARHDGRVIIGEVNNDLRGERVIFDASAAGLWVQDAVRRPNGQIVALGRPGGPYDNAPVALYNQNGTRLSGFIGAAAPKRFAGTRSETGWSSRCMADSTPCKWMADISSIQQT